MGYSWPDRVGGKLLARHVRRKTTFPQHGVIQGWGPTCRCSTQTSPS
eukprot:CAMPEP_0177225272 /NCGR_PEP_ID=MMETSP0367-20130122/39460_1 /TAXON_ID=447022 ORGANISM="Scrippsiella hangoei-like, Strain SHHI-4" /NCGR_SAMPLE_ID=MMETSP0367 /ASSEMBLY_ACC=CAM_ASM_000362 /LENGTH=46 /DNA_ID= /DNA_START= /DNA_END= /DNA_ORIENTATION=